MSDFDTVSVISSGSHGSIRKNNYVKQEYVDPKIAEKEQKAVFYSKMLVMTVLLMAVAGMASATHIFVTKTETKAFETQFKNYASEVISVSHDNAATIFEAIEMFSVSASSIAKASGQKWPFVTIPDFEAKGSRVVHLIGTVGLSFCPIVPDGFKHEWEEYANKHVKKYIQESIDYRRLNITFDSVLTRSTMTKVLNYTTWELGEETGPGPYLPLWQFAPFVTNNYFHNYNFLGGVVMPPSFYAMNATQRPVLNYANLFGEHRSQLIQPIFEDVSERKESRRIVGVVWTYMVWAKFLENILPDHVNGIIVVIDNHCGNVVSFEIHGLNASLLGEGDQHDPSYDNLEVSSDFVRLDYDEDMELPRGLCAPRLTMNIYPSDKMESYFRTNNATYYVLAVVGIFAFTSFVFVIYDYTVNRRQAKVMATVIRQDKIVSNLFPGAIKDRLYGFDQEYGDGNFDHPSNRMDDDFNSSVPLADLFPSTTIFFADIAGFTAWSSAREPSQVFTLLENIYGGFDRIANLHGVFKVETVGDCYVAASGLPEPREDHAVVMAKFARDCMHRMPTMVRKLEVTLGPDTGDLEMRIGLHTGQVTAGVLRGERSRFQLFGDSVNTAARMESTSVRGKIHISSTTADQIRVHGRSKWIIPRDETVFIKGKGEIQTYWLMTKAESKVQYRKENPGVLGAESCHTSLRAASCESSHSQERDVIELDDDTGKDDDLWDDTNEGMTKTQRLVEWNVDVLSKLLQQILAAREFKSRDLSYLEKKLADGSTVLEQFKEIITLPKVEMKDLQRRKTPDSIQLSEDVVSQLREYITNVAHMYRDNAFHNFEHASHVTASVRKMLTRIVSYDNPMGGHDVDLEAVDLEELVGHSYGITSDPLTQFAVVFSAVIHDLDHPGVPNAQLVTEETPISKKYKEKSVAEQNSVDLAWDMLMQPKYKELRACIYCNADELRRFRQLLVNVVMATDICDKELQALRKARWAKAFSETPPADSTPEDDVNRKATIVLEHLIQASDVSHTMQHWQIYKQWNEKFFMEMYGSYRSGRASIDPSEGWYKGEIGFFDFYIIPLAKKLENCGVFGVSSLEYLNYAISNRDEWAQKGEEIVQEYLKAYEAAHTTKS